MVGREKQEKAAGMDEIGRVISNLGSLWGAWNCGVELIRELTDPNSGPLAL